jgi:hypothetical protein
MVLKIFAYNKSYKILHLEKRRSITLKDVTINERKNWITVFRKCRRICILLTLNLLLQCSSTDWFSTKQTRSYALSVSSPLKSCDVTTRYRFSLLALEKRIHPVCEDRMISHQNVMGCSAGLYKFWFGVLLTLNYALIHSGLNIPSCEL